MQLDLFRVLETVTPGLSPGDYSMRVMYFTRMSWEVDEPLIHRTPEQRLHVIEQRTKYKIPSDATTLPMTLSDSVQFSVPVYIHGNPKYLDLELESHRNLSSNDKKN